EARVSLSIVLAGGGCRTAWSVGVLEELRDALPEPREWAGVSAGSCMAVGVAGRSTEPMMACFLADTPVNRRNVTPGRLGRASVFPHEAIYRATVAAGLDGAGLERLHGAGPVRILLAYTTPEARFARTFLTAVRGYRARKRAAILHGPEVAPPGLGIE